MANNVVKEITIDGHISDVAVIYRHATNLIDNQIALPYPSERIDNDSLGVLAEMLGATDEDMKAIQSHGWSEILSVDFPTRHSCQLIIETQTPYGNLSDFMAFMRRRFPDCEFHCYDDQDIENEED